MLELRLFVDPDAPLYFVEPTTPPSVAPNARRWLLSVDDLTLGARTGQYRGAYSDQNASVKLRLDNKDRQAVRMLGQPFRVRAEIYEDDALYFAGLVQGMDYGKTLELDIGA